MAASVIPCDSCGSPIPDSDLETGAAISLLGKRYCAGCKTEAIQNVSLDDLAAKPASRVAAGAPPSRPAAPKPVPPPPKAAPPPKVAAARAPLPPEASLPPARIEKKISPKRPSLPPRAPSRTPLIVGLAAAVGILVIVVVVLALKGGSSPNPGATHKPGSATSMSSTTTGPDRETQARDAYAKVEELTRRAGVSGDLILAAAEKAKAACRGTEWEKKLEEIRSKAAREKETEDAARDLTPLFDELKGAVATDPEFKRYVELQSKFQLLLEMAGKTGSTKMPEIRTLQKDYNGRYERTAEPFYSQINEAATALADERRYDDALKRIDAFPLYLRHSGAWLSLEQLKKDIERRKKK